MTADNEHEIPHGIALDTPARFEERVAAAADQVGRGLPHALMVVTVERFADVARECGPEAEAALLAIVSASLYEQLGAGAFGARLATDRLAVVRPACLPRDALALGKRIRVALEGGQFIWKGLSFRLAAAVGVLELGDATIPPADQIAAAARACAAAAALGGTGVVMGGGQRQELELAAEAEWREHLREMI